MSEPSRPDVVILRPGERPPNAGDLQPMSDMVEQLAPELREELERLSLPFTGDEVPSDAELRIAQAQLVGWLEGLFHGIQTALFAQQMAARSQLEEMRRRALPAGDGQPQPGASGPYL